LHDDAATHVAAGQHRHAEPVDTVRTEALVAGDAELRPQLLRRPHHRTAMAQHGHGQAVAQIVDIELLVRIGLVRVMGIDEIDEADPSTRMVVLHDHEVFGIHQVADDVVDAGQHLRHFEVGRGEVGDGIQRALQAFGGFEAVQRAAQALAIDQFGDAARQRTEIAPERIGLDLDTEPHRITGQQQLRAREQVRAAERDRDAVLEFLCIEQLGDAGFARTVVDQVAQVVRVGQRRRAAAVDVAAGTATDAPEHAQFADAELFAEVGVTDLRHRIEALAIEQIQRETRKLPVAVVFDLRRELVGVRLRRPGHECRECSNPGRRGKACRLRRSGRDAVWLARRCGLRFAAARCRCGRRPDCSGRHVARP
jgi:hypothetical protein